MESLKTLLSLYGRRMRQPFVLRDRYFLLFLASLTALSLAHFGYILLSVSRLPNLIILHQNVYFGIDRIGTWVLIFIFPIIQFAVALLNGVIGSALFTLDRTLSYLTVAGGVIVSCIILVGGVIVVRSNL